ncbi:MULTISPECIES: acyltransferase family protein [Olivibacter]|uniref:Acyltransferase family protein n=1 Tax=Olivibacter jilunii TaxID=985016 RepID=A0ABW6AWR7_9SPHI
MTYWKKLIDADNQRLAGLDHLRALAIVLVFLCHYRAYVRPEWVDLIGSFGWTGVDLFFVLSGFLIGNQLIRQMISLGRINFQEFYISRSFRILPVYFFVVSLYFLFPMIREREGIAPWWQFLTFTQNFDLDFGTEGSFSHAWSLCIEEQFYLALPFYISAFWDETRPGKAFWLLLGFFLLSVLSRALNWFYFVEPFYANNITDGRFVAYNKWVYYPTYNRFDGLLVGVGIAALVNFFPTWIKRIEKHANALFIIGALLISVAYLLLKEDRLGFWPTVLGFPLISVAFGFMVLSAILPASFLYRFKWRTSALIATLSYSIYLCHKFVNHLLQAPLNALDIPIDSNWRVAVCALMCILIALLLNRVIEYPFMKLKSTILKKRRQRTKNPLLVT